MDVNEPELLWPTGDVEFKNSDEFLQLIIEANLKWSRTKLRLKSDYSNIEQLTNKLESLNMDNLLKPSGSQNLFRAVDLKAWRLFTSTRPRLATVLQEPPRPGSLTRIQQMYARVVMRYNQSTQKRTNLLNTFTRLAKKKFKDIYPMWSVLENMVGLVPLSLNVNNVSLRLMAPEFLQKVRIFLEDGHRQRMNRLIQESKLPDFESGMPNVYNQVSSYVRLTFHLTQTMCGLLDVCNDRPLWPHVYFSLRSGDLGAALCFLRDWGNVCPDLSMLLQQQQHLKQNQHHLDQQLEIDTLEERLTAEYHSQLKFCRDFYKKAVYAVVLACDPEETHPEVVRTVDDFLWLQFLVNRDLCQLSISKIWFAVRKHFGENVTNKCESVSIDFRMFILTGHFEFAIKRLLFSDVHRPHGVHMAIALSQFSMLGTLSEPEDLCHKYRLDVGHLIACYAKCFEETDIEKALNYYYMLRNNKATDGSNPMLTYMSDMLAKTCSHKNFRLIFGFRDEHDCGLSKGGYFDKLPYMGSQKYKLADMVAIQLIKLDKYEMAIELLFLIGQLDNILGFVSLLLSKVVHQPKLKGSLRERLVAIVKLLRPVLAERQTYLCPSFVQKYILLTDLMQFFDLYYGDRLGEALQVLDNNKLIPINGGEVIECFTKQTALQEDIIILLPHIMLAALDILSRKYQTARADRNPVAFKTLLKSRIRALISLTNKMSMSQDIIDRLNQMMLELKLE